MPVSPWNFATHLTKCMVVLCIVEQLAHITLLQAKSKVDPDWNKATLPKPELYARFMLSRLLDKTVKALDVAEGWCRYTPAEYLKHIKPAENPADVISPELKLLKD